MRLSLDPQIFSVPDLKPAVGKIQNGCQRKHIVIHVTIICLDVRATYNMQGFFFGGGGGGGGESGSERSLPYLMPISQAGRIATTIIVTRKSSLF